MYVVNRHFYIPKTPDEVALLQGTSDLHMITVRHKDREYNIYTEEESDIELMQDYINKYNRRYYFDAVVLDKDIDPEYMADYIVSKVRPEVIVDIRENTAIGFNFDTVRVKIDGHGIHYRWIPALARKDRETNGGLHEIRNIMKMYRRIAFVGCKEKKLNKVCKLLKAQTKLQAI